METQQISEGDYNAIVTIQTYLALFATKSGCHERKSLPVVATGHFKTDYEAYCIIIKYYCRAKAERFGDGNISLSMPE